MDYQCQNSFLQWYQSGSSPIGSPTVPNGYIKDACRESPVVMVHNEQYKFFFDFETPFILDHAAEDEYDEVILVDLSGTEVPDVLTTLGLERVTTYVSLGVYDLHYRLTVTLNTNALRGYYRLKFVDVDTHSWYSSMIMIRQAADIISMSCLIDFTTFRAIGVLPANEWQRVRIMANQTEFGYEQSIKQYRTANDRKLRNTRIYNDKYLTIETYHFDEKMHDAFLRLSAMDLIFLNGKGVIAKNAYKASTKAHTVLSKGTMEFYLTGVNMTGDTLRNYSDDYSSDYS